VKKPDVWCERSGVSLSLRLRRRHAPERRRPPISRADPRAAENEMQRLLIAAALLLLIAGLLWPWLSKLPLGRLPGDFRIEREGYSFHFPLMTSVLISVLLTLLYWWWRK
jgi:hypothetical protein